MRIATWNVNSIKARLPTVLEVLDAINCDVVCLQEIKCETDAFPYLGVREGHVAGVPAFLMRVGFVGELGFEVHVPGSHGHHVWKSLTQAGQRCGIRPFGVEGEIREPRECIRNTN